ncbi:MAG TPA: imidazole glycerol phosphate synthase subunit HisH [Gemmatimonadaceae bacterium]|nr:imidazole glycerol phosphate synthase subunit HisH [Gemmatimonadaceae bacterium]
MMRLAIFDYGAGNLHSLSKAIASDRRKITIETDIRAAMDTDVLVLPGVGAFGAAANAMSGAQTDLASALADGLPCIGICLGMQLLFDASEESSGAGIGLIPGSVRRLRTSRVPHMGWNQIDWRDNPNRQAHLETAYFANAYVCEPKDASSVLAWTTHQDAEFASVVRRANTIGVQFHPEKSSAPGRVFVNALIEDLVACR